MPVNDFEPNHNQETTINQIKSSLVLADQAEEKMLEFN